jgi:hypothetical protein
MWCSEWCQRSGARDWDSDGLRAAERAALARVRACASARGRLWRWERVSWAGWVRGRESGRHITRAVLQGLPEIYTESGEALCPGPSDPTPRLPPGQLFPCARPRGPLCPSARPSESVRCPQCSCAHPRPHLLARPGRWVCARARAPAKLRCAPVKLRRRGRDISSWYHDMYRWARPQPYSRYVPLSIFVRIVFVLKQIALVCRIASQRVRQRNQLILDLIQSR